jgi:PDZ domain
MQPKAIAAVTVGVILAAAAGARWIAHEPGDGLDAVQREVEDLTFDQSLSTEARISALEQAVSDERYARQLLQEELFILTGELETLITRRSDVALEDVALERSAVLERVETAPPNPSRRRGAEGRAERLVQAGFEPGQAEWIVQRESQLQMEALQARYEAERTGDAMNYFQSRTAASDALRNELGDAEYERYLAASGRPTSVAVSSVLESSPAQRAGLMPGDEITSYDGKRIFSMSDLTRQTLEGQPGEQVVVDVRRDGVSMQVVVPRGPIGIAGGRRFSR